MKNKLFLVWPLLVLCEFLWIGILPSHAQSSPTYSLTEPKRVLANEIYKRTQNPLQLLQNGKEYRYYYPRVQGDHFLQGKPLASHIIFDGVEYRNISLSYDIFNQLVFITSIQEAGNLYLILHKDKIHSFHMDGKEFLNIKDSEDDSILPNGIYQLAFDGTKHRFLVKWKKKKVRYPSSRAASVSGRKPFKFVDDKSYFLVVEGTTHQIYKKKMLLRLLGAEKEVKSAAKSAGIKLKLGNHDFDQNLVRLLNLLNQAGQEPS